MSSQQAPLKDNEPVAIGAGAADNLRYIRSTIEAAHAFTTVPGWGCIAVGAAALAAAGVEMIPGLAAHWLPVWLITAVVCAAVALYFMQAKAQRQQLSLRRTVAVRFFLTLGPAFFAGAILTVALYGTVERDVITGIWLLMYGAGIAACGVFSIPVVLIAGFSFIGLGAVALAAPVAWAPALMALGFGGIHIILGALVVRDHGG